MSDERLNDFGDDSKDFESKSPPESPSIKTESSQLTLINLVDGNKNDDVSPSKDNLIEEWPPNDDFEATFHLSDLPPIDSPVIHAPMPSYNGTNAPILSAVVTQGPFSMPVMAEEATKPNIESLQGSLEFNEICDLSPECLTQTSDAGAPQNKNGNIPLLLSFDIDSSCDNENRELVYHSTNNEENSLADNEKRTVNEQKELDVFFTSSIVDKNSNHIPNQASPLQLVHTKEQVDTNGDISTRETTFLNNNLPSLRHFGSIPNLVENRSQNGSLNGSQAFDRKRHPIYRLSLRLPHWLPPHFEIPNATSHSQFSKAGYLQKLSGRGFPYLNQWKRRYCILTKGCLFLYEKETSKGSDKNTSVVDLKYFDHVAEAMQKDSKKASNVFVVTSQDRSFFDPGRHLFAADTLTEMHDWIAKLRESIELIRNNNRPTSKKGQRKDSQESKLVDKYSDPAEYPSHLARPKSSPLEDTVDARIYRSEDTSREELYKNLQKEYEYQEGRSEKSSTEKLRAEQKEENTRQQSSSGKKLSFTKISLHQVDSKPQLESITKNRIRGPAGRRAPQSRRTVLMKQRASSMSALQHEGQLDEEARDDICRQNINDGYYEEERVMIDPGTLNSSQPILTYHYSSDEDSFEEDHMGSNRSIGKQVIGQYTSNEQNYSSKTTSFTIDQVPNQPVKGLRVYVSKEVHEPSAGRTLRPLLDPDGQDLLEYRSLPRSLARASNNNRTLAMKTLSKGLQTSAISGMRVSEERIASGRASPEMDALDNMLMNRSLHTSVADQLDGNISDHEGSETSTFKGTHEELDNKKSSASINSVELNKALERFSSTLQHLQHHTAELESRTKQIETDFNISKNDVVNLQEAAEGIRKDVKKLAETISSVAQEASKSKRDYVYQRQETDKLQKDVVEALAQAKRSQKEFENSKLEYELTIRDLHNLIASIKSSFIVTSQEEQKPVKKVSLAEAGKSYSENDKAIIERERNESSDYRKPNTDGKKAPSKEITQQKGGYQSFFQRPSSLIYGLTSKSNKSPKKERDDKDLAKIEKEEKRKSGKFNSDKKQKGEKQNSLEKKKKSPKTDDRDTNRDMKSQSKHKETTGEKYLKRDDNIDIQKCSPSFSIENFPMMDDLSDSLERKPHSARGISHVSINVSPVLQNFNLEKSLSSPTVTMKFSNKPVRPNVLSIPLTVGDGSRSCSNTSSPDSPTAPTNTLPFLTNNVSGRETRITTETMFPCQPANVSSITRQSSSEDKLVTRHRQGVFAISRQRSSPNLPIQRQSSGIIYPLQRQHSLGTVPEEGQLPRQVSLMSVPEDRPIVDQTLPLSPAPSMISFALSPCPSGDRLDNLRDRSSARNSMELVTGPIVSGSVIQESFGQQLPPSSEFNISESPVATSSLKRENRKKKTRSETLIL